MSILTNSPRRIFNAWDDDGMPAGERHIGQTGRAFVICSVSVLASTAGTYEAGNLAGTGGLLDFASAARVAGGKGVVRGATIVNRSDKELDFDLILFHTTTVSTTFTDEAALAIDDSDMAKIAGVITCATADYVDLGTNHVAWLKDENVYFDLPANVSTLYGAMMTASSWTPTTTSDIGISLAIEQF